MSAEKIYFKFYPSYHFFFGHIFIDEILNILAIPKIITINNFAKTFLEIPIGFRFYLA